MEIVKPIPAATILLSRDSDKGLEILMLTKARGQHFAVGAMVFPGGKVDAKDIAFAKNIKNINKHHAELKVAAIREMYEECGILLARHLSTNRVISSGEATKIREANEGCCILDMARAGAFELATEDLVSFAHWITPQERTKRFDTHFFIARAPDFKTTPVVEGYEIIDAKWCRPGDILEDVYSGRLRLVLPTMLNVILLSGFSCVNGALHGFSGKDIFCVEPKHIETDEGVQFSIPAEAGYGVTLVSSEFLRLS